MKTKYEIFIDSIAYALEDHSYSIEWYFDFDNQDIVPVSRDSDCCPEEGHRVIRIDPMPSRLSFGIMEDFADNVSDYAKKAKLFSALSRKHPFSSFQQALCYTDLRQEWFAFKEESMRHWVERWMKENGVDFKEDCAVCDNTVIWVNEEEEEEDEDFDADVAD